MTTLLDQAHRAMRAAPEDDRLRLRFLERLADAELCLLLEGPPEGERIRPRTFRHQSHEGYRTPPARL